MIKRILVAAAALAMAAGISLAAEATTSTAHADTSWYCKTC